MDISGHWYFFEEFDFGFDIGTAVLLQSGETINGTLVYTEYIQFEAPFTISIEVEGELFEDRMVLRGQSHNIESFPQNIPYEMDDRAGLVQGDIIKGQSIDDQDLHGSFFMKRIVMTTNS